MVSCNTTDKSVDVKPIVVTVYGKSLYEEDLSKQIPFDASVEDSTSIRNSYINSWIDRQLMVRQAELNLPSRDQDVTRKLEKYRNDLLIFAYQNRLLLEKLDTNVSNTEVEEYYEKNKGNFALVDYILKAQYLKLDSTDKNLKKVGKWFVSDKEGEFEKLEDYCYMHSSNYSFEGEWMYLSQLLDIIPIVSYNKEKLLKNKKLIKFYDNGNCYLVRIVDYKLKDGVSPISLEKENIKRIILNNRKLQFLDKLSSDIYQNAKNQKEIEIFTP
ncbi:MAG: hypothetical protein ACI85Q_001278 [Salibacteraceae bacterium]|jgi:hypothetical protein